MTSWPELIDRIKVYLRFSRQELSGLIPAIIVTAFIFSFRDWGDESFNLIVGFTHFGLVLIIATISFLFYLSCQKIYALGQGNKADFKVWWPGLLISLVLAFVSSGRVPLIFSGGMVIAFMTRHRLGEFRYGQNTIVVATTHMWASLSCMIMAILFAIGLHMFPQSYFFHKGLILNIILAFSSLLPIPRLDGLGLFFHSLGYYFFALLIFALGAVLLLTRTTWGLIAAIVIGSIGGLVFILIGSEK